MTEYSSYADAVRMYHKLNVLCVLAGVKKQVPLELPSDRLVDDVMNLASQDSGGELLACTISSCAVLFDMCRASNGTT